MGEEKPLRCPKCNSTHLSANKKGFGVGKALTGALLTGGIGLLAGGIGSNKLIITCLACGYKDKAGGHRWTGINRTYLSHKTENIIDNDETTKPVNIRREEEKVEDSSDSGFGLSLLIFIGFIILILFVAILCS